MINRSLQDRLNNLTDALLGQADMDAAFLASILLATQDAIAKDELAAFALRVWRANHPEAESCDSPTAPEAAVGSAPTAAALDSSESQGRRRKVG